MKKLLASLVAVFALLPAQAASADILNLTAGVFPDDQLSALSSTGDPFAVGGGTVGNASGTHFAFAAHLSPNGPSGYAVVSDPALGEAQGHVCAYLPATTNDARFSINVEKGSGFLGSVSNLDFVVEDGGEPPSGADLFVVEAALGCQGQAHGGTGGPVVQGNIVVKNP